MVMNRCKTRTDVNDILLCIWYSCFSFLYNILRYIKCVKTHLYLAFHDIFSNYLNYIYFINLDKNEPCWNETMPTNTFNCKIVTMALNLYTESTFFLKVSRTLLDIMMQKKILCFFVCYISVLLFWTEMWWVIVYVRSKSYIPDTIARQLTAFTSIHRHLHVLVLFLVNKVKHAWAI